MNKLVPLLAAVGIATAACGSGTDGDAGAPGATTPAAIEPAAGEPTDGTPFSYQNIDLVIPAALDSTAGGATVPKFDDRDQDPWAVAPEHTKITLSYGNGAAPDGSQILVYPVAGMTAMDRAEDIDLLRAALSDPENRTLDKLPRVPYLNAAPAVTADVEAVDFHSGQGLRFLTEYQQEAAPVDNGELFYNFQGLTSDGAYYVVAILPVDAGVLASDGSPGATVPPGGVAWPGLFDIGALKAYFPQVTDALNAADEDAFDPKLGVLDQLIQSLEIS